MSNTKNEVEDEINRVYTKFICKTRDSESENTYPSTKGPKKRSSKKRGGL